LFTLKTAVVKEKTAWLFLSKLLILLSALKCVFFFYNYRVANGWSVTGVANVFQLIKWSLFYDVACITLLHLPLFIFFLLSGKLIQKKIIRVPVIIFYSLANTLLLLLNTVDIFYFRFHLQRADADLLYVLRNPFANGTFHVILLVLAIIFYCVFIARFIYGSLIKMLTQQATGVHFVWTTILLFILSGLFFLSGQKKIVPTYPLTQLEAVQLPLAQNSFHTFLYSVYRKNETALPAADYMATAQMESLFSIHKKNNPVTGTKKNIVLFIMESVPYDFFDSSSRYKVSMPFVDSLVNKSTFFSNAFSFSYNSNKGITALLAGLPTLTDIPLYHSSYTAINRSLIGKLLAKNNYSSSFFIGDNYDDMGFAQCCKWLGIQHYYCMQDIPGYRQMEKHSMGLQDEYVLSFMQNKLAAMQQPFFAVQYNISTHYPNDLPKLFIDKYPLQNTTPPMKTMQYYNDCLQQFFKDAATKDWYKNTVFIFCSDHWADPDIKNFRIDETGGFRIPLFIYDPANEKKKTINTPVSQLDVFNTILHFGSKADSIISYGSNLADTTMQKDRTVFTRMNSAVYEAINNEYVLGFNAVEGKPMYCFDYLKDPQKKNNLLHKVIYSTKIDSMILQMKAFLQTASNHYRNNHAANE
jgi:phosphoglycerol transferase MdoB-like AlkP superfamily enzyme